MNKAQYDLTNHYVDLIFSTFMDDFAISEGEVRDAINGQLQMYHWFFSQIETGEIAYLGKSEVDKEKK